MASKISVTKIKAIAYKCSVYSIALFVLSIAQVTFFSKINVLSATPDLMLGAVLLIAMKDDQRVSSICGIVSGFLYCTMGGFVYPFYMMFSFLCGYVLWIISDRFLGKNYVSYLALAVLAFSLKALFNVIEASLFAYTINILNMFTKAIIPEFISSMTFCTVSYLIFNSLSRLLNSKSNKKGKT